MMTARNKIKAHMDWDKALPAVTETIGEPTVVEGALHEWYFVEPKQKLCYQLSIEKAEGQAGPQVGKVQLGALAPEDAATIQACGGDPSKAAAGGGGGGGGKGDGSGGGNGTGGGGGNGTGGGAGGRRGTGAGAGGDGVGPGGGKGGAAGGPGQAGQPGQPGASP
jgi:hypothetical protein